MLIIAIVIVVCCIFADNSVLDCIYSDVNRTYYVLDLMCWSSYPIYDSEVLFSATCLLFSCAFDVPHVMWSLYSSHTECGWMEAQCSIWACNEANIKHQISCMITDHWFMTNLQTTNRHLATLNGTHTHTQPFYGPFSGTTRVSRSQKKSLSALCGGRGDIRGRHTDNPAGRHSIQTNQCPSPSFPHFCARCLSAATLPIYPGLGQAPNMLACIPSGLLP